MKHDEFKTQREQIMEEMIQFLRDKDVDRGQACIILKDVQLWIEHTSLRKPV